MYNKFCKKPLAECSAALAAVAMGDKKRAGKKITLVLPRAFGESILYPIEAKDLEAFFAKGLEA